LIREVDLVIVGAGFGGSLMAMVAHQLGLSVALLEQGRHPRMAIGESTTPLSNLLLERLSATYDLPRLAPLAKWGSWQRAYPQVACGRKRGFSFFHQGEELLVAASPHDAIADTHWYRADVDHFLVKEAQALGVDYRDHVRIGALEFTGLGVTVAGHSGEEAFDLRGKFLIDATGPRGFLHSALRLEESALPGMPATESLYSHFTGVQRTESAEDTPPFPVDDAAVHYLFDGGWVWVLRFNNGVTSAGVAATKAVSRELALQEGAPAWQRLLTRLPALQSQFKHAVACQPFRHLPAISFRSRIVVGERWAMLPSAAGFVDPLLSTGFTLTLMGIERLAQVIREHLARADLAAPLREYAQETEDNLLAASRMIGALYAAMGDFAAFTRASFVYFAAVSFAETAYRLNKPELAPGFLLHRHPQFGPASRRVLEGSCKLEDVLRLIEPFNVGGFGDPARGNRYPVRAEDLLDARSKLGASHEEIVALLEKSGFYTPRVESRSLHSAALRSG
jgi:FADH2 O2-dependent halogenase